MTLITLYLAVCLGTCLLWDGSSNCIFHLICYLFSCWYNEEFSIESWSFSELLQYSESCIFSLILDTVPSGKSHFMLSGGSAISYVTVIRYWYLVSFPLPEGNVALCTSWGLHGLCSASLTDCGQVEIIDSLPAFSDHCQWLGEHLGELKEVSTVLPEKSL